MYDYTTTTYVINLINDNVTESSRSLYVMRGEAKPARVKGGLEDRHARLPKNWHWKRGQMHTLSSKGNRIVKTDNLYHSCDGKIYKNLLGFDFTHMGFLHLIYFLRVWGPSTIQHAEGRGLGRGRGEVPLPKNWGLGVLKQGL